MSSNLVAVLAAITSLTAALATVLLGAYFEHRRQRAHRENTRQDVADRYSQPLMASASALASRLGNATTGQIREFTTTEGERGDRYRDYLLHETLYRLARYLCWVHIISRELRVLDLGNQERNRELVLRVATVQREMSRRDIDLTFMLLGGEQAALGELMAERDGPDGEPRCMSYVTFRERVDSDPGFRRWFEPLIQDIASLATGPERGAARLAAVRAALMELVEVLDPEHIWVPFRHEGD